MLNNKSILITGGTGSLGKHLTKTILIKWPNTKRLVIFSRDEQKQFQMAQEFPNEKYPNIRYFIGDVRDKERLLRAMEGIDVVIHAAAMKHVHIAEYNPSECILTNIKGAENVIHASLEKGITDVVALSTDKACAPINLYGATKLVSDKLFVAANNIKGSKNIKFSVIPFFMNHKNKGYLPITDPEMTRFNISLDDGVAMVLHALENAWGGEIFIPKIPSYKIMDIAKAIAPDLEHRTIGIRPGEKLHEEMIAESDSFYTYDLGKYYTILPSVTNWDLADYIQKFNAKIVPKGFKYNSDTNTEWDTVEGLRDLIIKHIDPNFSI